MEQRGALEDLTILDLTRVRSLLRRNPGRPGREGHQNRDSRNRRRRPQLRPLCEWGERLFCKPESEQAGDHIESERPQGERPFLRLVKEADILIENFRPGVMDKLGLGYEGLKKVNDQLIYAAVSGFGSYGPYSQHPGYDDPVPGHGRAHEPYWAQG